jgi:hypothetical protein
MHFVHNAIIVHMEQIQVRVFMQTITHNNARLPGMIPPEHCGSEANIMEILEEYLGLVRCLY